MTRLAARCGIAAGAIAIAGAAIVQVGLPGSPPAELRTRTAAGDGAVDVSPAPGPGPGPGVQRSVHHYRWPPTLSLLATDGQARPLDQVLFDGRTVVLSFMFSSCATVCPVSNQTLVALEEALGDDRARVRTVSLSIDPDHDTVRQMAEHARRSGRRGDFYTSDPGTSEAVQRAFDVWRGDKMNHPPVFLIGSGAGRPWVRLEGAASPRELLDELRRIGALAP